MVILLLSANHIEINLRFKIQWLSGSITWSLLSSLLSLSGFLSGLSGFLSGLSGFLSGLSAESSSGKLLQSKSGKTSLKSFSLEYILQRVLALQHPSSLERIKLPLQLSSVPHFPFP